jgi:hypothetical protein
VLFRSRFPENKEDPIDSEVINFFCSITTKSPFGILNVKRHNKELEVQPELYKDINKRDKGQNLSSAITERLITGKKSGSLFDESIKGKKLETIDKDGKIIETEVGIRPGMEYVNNKLTKGVKYIRDSISTKKPNQSGGERINEPEKKKNEKKNDFSCSVDNESTNFIGLSDHSYILIIISYAIPLIIILEGLVRNLLFSIYSIKPSLLVPNK